MMDALILAGGENRRFFSNKGLATVNGKRIIDTTSSLLVKYFKKVWISTYSPENFFCIGLPMIGDVINPGGPLAGIFSLLVNSSASAVFVTACDMPFIEEGMVRLINSAFEEQAAVIPIYEGRPQPLLGIYPQRVRDLMEERIRIGRVTIGICCVILMYIILMSRRSFRLIRRGGLL